MHFASRCILMIFLSAAASAQAHETLPEEWCTDPNTVPRIVATFSFSQHQLLALSQAFPAVLLPTCTNPEDCGSCGGVDEWHPANRIAHEYCASFDERPGQTMPIVDSLTFNGNNHHYNYRFDQGLNGSCVVCEPRVR